MASRADVRGVEELSRKLTGMAQKASGSQLAAALRAGGLVIEVPAKIKAPVLTGNLRRSIHTETAVSGSNEAEARVGTNVEYAPHVEFGTSKQRAQPHLRPAYDENKNAAVDEIAAVLEELTRP
jgi:HK97 gp10 family phage protein